MKFRFIIPHEKTRFILRGPVSDSLWNMARDARVHGMTMVGLPKYILHILFWWRKARERVNDNGPMAESD